MSNTRLGSITVSVEDYIAQNYAAFTKLNSKTSTMNHTVAGLFRGSIYQIHIDEAKKELCVSLIQESVCKDSGGD